MSLKCTIELFVDGRWMQAAEFRSLNDTEAGRGHFGDGYLIYETDYALDHLDCKDHRAISCRYDVNHDAWKTTGWPAFLLDLMPAGAARRTWQQRLKIQRDGAEADWEMLMRGAGNPPGNMRIAEAAEKLDRRPHQGFDRSDVLARREDFVEYAYQNGAPVAGSTGAQGDAPKYLLTQDRQGKWHADGSLNDEQVAKHWLVKFPRGTKKPADVKVLKNEAAYAAVAKAMGLRTHELPTYEDECLFVPRFDRVVEGQKVHRFGLETLASAAGIADFAVPTSHLKLCEAIAQHCNDAVAELKEYVYRDVLNVALGNTDNHARNTSLIKLLDGTVKLAPLYDMAPMYLDPEGIARNVRWAGETEPEWGKVAEELARFGMPVREFRSELFEFAKKVQTLPELMKKAGVDDDVIEQRSGTIDRVVKSLKGAKPK